MLSKFLPHNIIKYQLYIFQLEEYDYKRFFNAILKKGFFPPNSLRKQAKWTIKAKAMVLIALILQVVFSFISAYLLTIYTFKTIPAFFITFLILFYLFIVLSFIFLEQAQDILSPVESYQKNKIINSAKTKLKEIKSQNPKLKIIGITGSYGKTTMKEVLNTVLNSKYNVLSTAENFNTPIGIARAILKNLNVDTEIFIVEMGEYVKGDVSAICKITPPDISIITGINEAHLERYGTMQNAIDTKFEIVENTPENGLVILNADDELIRDNYKRFAKDRSVKWYSALNHSLSDYKVSNIEIDQKNLGLNFEIGELKFKTKFLAKYIMGNIIAAMLVAKELGISDPEIRLAAVQISPVPHRLEPSRTADDIIIIDDTYNGNSTGIEEGIKLLSEFKDRRKVYITPGLVETGTLQEEIHTEIGKKLSKVADIVVLTKNSVTGFIEKGLLDSGFSKENIIWFDDSKTTYASLNKFAKSGDVIMMQNDWSDNYV